MNTALPQQGLVRFLALIPAYNEAQRIMPVIHGALEHLPVLVVDDGSSDDTAAAADAEGALVLRQDPNQGKGVALRAGFKYALQAGYQAVLTLDADGQHDPSEISAFLEKYASTQADLIIGARDFSQIPPLRRLANSLGRITFSWAVGQDIPDNQSGYRLISRRLMQELLDSQERGFEFEVEMLKVCIQRGYRLEWVPIRTIYADESSHISPLNHVQNFLRLVLQTRRDMRGR
jgi:glycosyltransferase involved in cell wall biosynthesis